MKKYLSMISIFLCLIFLLTGCGGKVVATVNGEKITEEELNKRVEQAAAMYGFDLESDQGKEMRTFLQEQTLQVLIDEKVILQAAAKKDLEVSQEELDKEIKKIKDQFSNDKDYEEFLKERKFTEKDLNTYLQNSLIYKKLFDDVTKDITSTERDIKAYYQENKEEFNVPEMVKARNIVVKTEEEARTVIERLDKGEDFATVAVEVSIDPTVQQNQGDIGYFGKDANLLEEFKDAAFALEINEYTKEPVQTMYGYHIIKVEDRTAAHQRSFEEVEKELEDRFILEEKNETFSRYVEDLIEKADIEKNLPKEENGSNQENPEQSNEENQGSEPDSTKSAE